MTFDEVIKLLHRVDKCNKKTDNCYGIGCEDCEYCYDDEELVKIPLQLQSGWKN